MKKSYRIYIRVVSVLFILFGLWIISSGKEQKRHLESKKIYNQFQEHVFTQAYHIKKLYHYDKGSAMTAEDLNKLKMYLADLEEKKTGLLSQIDEFPDVLSELKHHAHLIYDESEVIYDHYKNGYKDVIDTVPFAKSYNETFNAALKATYDCSISTTSVRRKIEKTNALTDFLTSF